MVEGLLSVEEGRQRLEYRQYKAGSHVYRSEYNVGVDNLYIKGKYVGRGAYIALAERG
jgi:hypothetical protein